MKKSELFLFLMTSLILVSMTTAWRRRRRRRRCDTTSCSWTWGQCSATCGGGTQSSVVTKPQGQCGSCNLPAARPCNTQCCPVNCIWASWGSWSACSTTCGDGTRTRSRGYAQASSCGGSSCPGSSTQTTSCSHGCCPVNCIWGPWGKFGDCSESCGGGEYSRSRNVEVSASCGGVECSGSNTDIQECNTQCCPLDCRWGEWEPFSECSASCGGGSQIRRREVVVTASCAGEICYGTDSDSQTCNDVCCPVDCVWTAWSEYGTCSVSCGGGFQTRTRSVVANEKCGGRCDGEASESQNCNDVCCPVDCKWGPWSDFDSCSVSCGGGAQTRRRSISVSASCGGKSCDGLDADSRACNDICCPVDCVWDSWSGFGECTITCGGGIRTRTRDFLVPSSCNGLQCTGPRSENISCNNQCCAVNCVWEEWGEFTPCSASCGCGDQSRTRGIAITESCGGAPCMGVSQEIQSCNTNCCPVDCVWGPWGNFGTCSVTCGAGNHTRYRHHAVSASCEGKPCQGPLADTMPCNNNCCPINCMLEEWGEFGSCSVTCGGGVQSRTRSIEVRPTGGGQSCLESLVETTSCNNDPCPVDCVWSDWSVWSECSLPCGVGDQQRNRTVLVYKENDGDLCKGPSIEHRTCNDNCCPVDCAWQEWTDWSTCSKTCDGGVQVRRRSHETTSVCGGRECVGEFVEQRSCNEICCPVDCRWSEWTKLDSCSSPCGGGLQSRYRSISEEASCGGTQCAGKEVETYPCNEQCCGVDCEISSWSSWSVCSQSCGSHGLSVRSRTILTYPECGGSSCDGDLLERRHCNQICLNEGAFVGEECACADGWQGECCDVDQDECVEASSSTPLCHEHAYCLNIMGGYECLCKAGYKGDGYNLCEDINECFTGGNHCSGDSVLCDNTVGSYKCMCDDGLLPIEGGCFEYCEMTSWSSWSACSATCGASGASTRHRELLSPHNCSHSCHAPTTETTPCNQRCFNEGELEDDSCQCKKGWMGKCCDIDINECEDTDASTPLCADNADCVNTKGGFSCRCKIGFSGDGLHQCLEIS